MGNIDIDEWMLNNNFNQLLIIKDKNGKDFFLSDILERHLKEQLIEIFNQSPNKNQGAKR